MGLARHKKPGMRQIVHAWLCEAFRKLSTVYEVCNRLRFFYVDSTISVSIDRAEGSLQILRSFIQVDFAVAIRVYLRHDLLRRYIVRRGRARVLENSEVNL